MRHKWTRHPDSETVRRPFQVVRLCTNCGAEQTKHSDHEWGRVVGYHWWPTVGRCKREPTVVPSGDGRRDRFG